MKSPRLDFDEKFDKHENKVIGVFVVFWVLSLLVSLAFLSFLCWGIYTLVTGLT